MTDVPELGEVIARRIIKTPDGGMLEVKLGRPQRSGTDEAFCPIQIANSSFGEVQRIYGIDEFQAIELATKIIGTMLHVLNRDEYSGGLRWLTEPDLGFPMGHKENAPIEGQ